MNREQAFHGYKNHPWLHRLYNRLRPVDRDLAVAFIRKNEHLDKGQFDVEVNRLFMDDRNPPKLWKEIMELLSCANSSNSIEKV